MEKSKNLVFRHRKIVEGFKSIVGSKNQKSKLEYIQTQNYSEKDSKKILKEIKDFETEIKLRKSLFEQITCLSTEIEKLKTKGYEQVYKKNNPKEPLTSGTKTTHVKEEEI